MPRPARFRPVLPPGPMSSPADLSHAPQPRRRPARAGTRPTRSLRPMGTPASIRPATRVRGRPSRSSSLSPSTPTTSQRTSSATASTRCSTRRRSTASSLNGGPGSGEAALDIENVIGLAPKANIAVYEGPNSGDGPYDTMNAIISQHLAQVVTTSWGQCEPAEGSQQTGAENTLFQEAAAQGMSVLSASGDDGSEDCDGTGGAPQDALEVDDPASQPYVTGVGGTTLSADSTRRPPGRDRVERRIPDRRQRRRRLDLLGDARLPVPGAVIPARHQRQLLGLAVQRSVGRLPGGARRIRGRRPANGLRDLLERVRRGRVAP